MVAAPAGLSEPPIGDRVEADAFWVAFDPDKQSGPRCIEVLFFVAPGNGEHVWQCLDPTCGVTVAVPSRVVWKWPERVVSGAVRLAAIRRQGQAGRPRWASRPGCASRRS